MKRLKIRTGAREKHELCWRKYLVEVTKSSNVDVLEIIPLAKLQKYANNDLFLNVVTIIKSVNSALWMKEGAYEKLSVSPTYDISNKMRVIYQHHKILKLHKTILKKYQNLRQHHVL